MRERMSSPVKKIAIPTSTSSRLKGKTVAKQRLSENGRSVGDGQEDQELQDH
jgi:hypothetical protein